MTFFYAVLLGCVLALLFLPARWLVVLVALAAAYLFSPAVFWVLLVVGGAAVLVFINLS